MPGESREVVVEIRQKQLAVFSEERQAWIVEAGTYGIWVGKQSGFCCALGLSHSPPGSGSGENAPDLSPKRAV